MIYLDYAATTPQKYFAKSCQYIGNADSFHNLGFKGSKILDSCRQTIKECLNVKTGQVFFGGTASQIFQALLTQKGITHASQYDHSATFDLSDYNTLSKYQHDYFSGDIYTHIHVNNLNGDIYDCKEYGLMARNNKAYFILDTTATPGHAPFPDDMDDWCDGVVCSGHKFYGPQGTGFCWLSDRFVKFLHIESDRNIMPGTKAVSNVWAMTQAFEDVVNSIELLPYRYSGFATYLETKLSSAEINFKITKNPYSHTDAILLITFNNLNGEALTQFLSNHNIYISPAHSACAEDGDYRQAKALGLTQSEAEHSIRVSFGVDTTYPEIDYFCKKVKEFSDLFGGKNEDY